MPYGWEGISVGLAFRWPCVRDLSRLSAYDLCGLVREMSTPSYPSQGVRSTLPFTFRAWTHAVASPGSGARAAQNYMKLFVAHKMTRNNTPNKVHV